MLQQLKNIIYRRKHIQDMEKIPEDGKQSKGLDLQIFFKKMYERTQKNIMGNIWENEQNKLRKVYFKLTNKKKKEI